MRKLDVVQKNVLFHSGTNVQVGSGWKPLKMGLVMVAHEPKPKATTAEKRADLTSRTMLSTPLHVLSAKRRGEGQPGLLPERCLYT
jgi:hypothetical protein